MNGWRDHILCTVTTIRPPAVHNDPCTPNQIITNVKLHKETKTQGTYCDTTPGCVRFIEPLRRR